MKKLLKRNRCSDIEVEKVPFGDGMIQHYKFEIGPYGEVKIIEGELEDRDAFIQSNKENAGAYSYITEQMAQGKTLDQIIQEGNLAIAKQTFVDVSNLGGQLTASEVEERIADGIKGVEEIAARLGVSPDAYVKMTPDEVDALIKKVVAQNFEKEKVAEQGDK